MVKQRNEIDEKYQWDLSTIFATDQAWEDEASSLAADMKAASLYAGHLLDSAQNLLETTEAYLELSRRLEKVYVYAHMKNDQDTRVAKYQEYQSKGMALYSLLGETFAFYEPEFMAITDEQYKAFVKEIPALEQYGHYFDRLLEKKACLVSQRRRAACWSGRNLCIWWRNL